MNASTTLQTADGIDAEQERFFREQGYLVLDNLLDERELSALRAELGTLMTSYDPEHPPVDFSVGKGHRSGQPVLRRIEYPVDKSEACRALMGHPFILNSIERLQGRAFIPTWDAMVVKMPHEGIAVPWHQDAKVACAGEEPIFNVDFYLDDSDTDTAVWAIPGSHLWPASRLRPVIERGMVFPQEGAVPVPVKAGSVMLHNIKLLHGSPPNSGPHMRRVIYYEFRPAHVELSNGPHTPEYIPLKQRVLRACIECRQRASYIAADEKPYVYRPEAPFDRYDWKPGEMLGSYRYEHRHYYRS